MSTSLTKLQILLNDILVNARAKRIQKSLNLSFGDKDYITLLDVKNHFSETWDERDLFTTIDELNKINASDFLVENAVFYFFMRTIQIKDPAFFKSESNQQKDLIFKTIEYIHSNKLMDESLTKEREFFSTATSEVSKNNIEAFYQLVEAKMPKEEFFDCALGFYIGTASKMNPYWYNHFKPIINYVGQAQNPKEFSKLINEIIVKYFYIFCDLQTIDTKFMHTELNLIERRISNQDYTNKVLSAWNIQNIYDMVCIDCIVRDDDKQYILEELIAKVFYNDYSISYSLQSNRNAANEANEFWKRNMFKDKILENDIIGFKRDDYYTTPYQLFNTVFYTYKKDFDNNPGIITCLYLLSTEMDSDSFFNFFSLDKKNENDYELASHYLKEIDYTLEIEDLINQNLEISGKRGKDFRRFYNIFYGYKDAIKKGKTEECLTLQKEKRDLDMGLDSYSDLKLKRDLLQRFLWFVVFFKCGLYYDNDEDIYKSYSRRDEMLIGLLNDLTSGEYANIEYANKKFNALLHKIGVENKIDLTIEKIKDYKNIVLLVYNLSRAEFSSKEFLINEINSIRELQKDLLHVDRRKPPEEENEQTRAEDVEEYNKLSSENLLKLKKIDCGFKIKTYSQYFYPLSAKSFKTKNINLNGNIQGLFSAGFEHQIKCKLIWETDNEFQKNGSFNWPEINKKGLTTRYLYRDRNSYTHHSDHSSVSALLDPKSWKNLLRALSHYYLLLRGKMWCDRIAHREEHCIYNIQQDDNFFQNLYLQSEVEDVYRIITLLVQEKTGIPPKPWQIFDENKYEVTVENSGLSVEEFINYIKKNKKHKADISYSDIPDKIDSSHNIFEMRLERLLRIMFMVNDFDPVDQRLSVKFMDFYTQYNMEISIYLIYMAFAMNYCDDVKV